MISWLAVKSIGVYQHHLSPRKGFCCAYRARYGAESCSVYAARLICEAGFRSAAPLIHRRFRECRAASLAWRDGAGRTGSGPSLRRPGSRTGEGCDIWPEIACCALDAGAGECAMNTLGCGSLFTGG